MGPIRLFLAIAILGSMILFGHLAPTDLLTPPRTLEGDTAVNPISIDESLDEKQLPKEEEVTTTERYYRLYENGTIEFKTALSNGHIQYQRISNKVVDGKTIQVYEGYVSQRYADGRYGTTYYIADENGYRRTRVEVDTHPPVLRRSLAYPIESPETNEKLIKSDTKTAPASEKSDEENAAKGPKSLGEAPPDSDHESDETTTDANVLKPTEDEKLEKLPGKEENTSENPKPNTGTEITSSAEENITTAAEDDSSLLSSTETITIEGSTNRDNTDNIGEGEATTEKGPESTENIAEDKEGSGELEPTTERVDIDETGSSTENSSSFDDNTTLTDANNEDNAISTDLTAVIEDGGLEPIRKSNTSSQEEERATFDSSELTKSEDNAVDSSTKLTNLDGTEDTEASSESSKGIFEASAELSALEEQNLDASTEVLPVTEEILSKTSQGDAIQNEATTESSVLESTTGENTDIYDATEVPALPVTEKSSFITKEDEASTELPSIEDENLQTSAEVPALPITEEVKTETSALKNIPNEANTELPALDTSSDENNFETKTDNSAIQGKISTQSPSLSSNWPLLPLSENISTELPALTISNDNITKTLKNEGDQLTLGDNKYADGKIVDKSTELPTSSNSD